MGEAFCRLLERFPAKTLPKAGGGLVTVLVTIELQHLLDGLRRRCRPAGTGPEYLTTGRIRITRRRQ